MIAVITLNPIWDLQNDKNKQKFIKFSKKTHPSKPSYHLLCAYLSPTGVILTSIEMAGKEIVIMS